MRRKSPTPSPISYVGDLYVPCCCLEQHSAVCPKQRVIVTTNLTFGEWPSVFGDANIIKALLDSLMQHCEVVDNGKET